MISVRTLGKIPATLRTETLLLSHYQHACHTLPVWNGLYRMRPTFPSSIDREPYAKHTRSPSFHYCLLAWASSTVERLCMAVPRIAKRSTFWIADINAAAVNWHQGNPKSQKSFSLEHAWYKRRGHGSSFNGSFTGITSVPFLIWLNPWSMFNSAKSLTGRSQRNRWGPIFAWIIGPGA